MFMNWVSFDISYVIVVDTSSGFQSILSHQRFCVLLCSGWFFPLSTNSFDKQHNWIHVR